MDDKHTNKPMGEQLALKETRWDALPRPDILYKQKYSYMDR